MHTSIKVSNCLNECFAAFSTFYFFAVDELRLLIPLWDIQYVFMFPDLGGDDCKLKGWDLRVGPSCPTFTSKRWVPASASWAFTWNVCSVEIKWQSVVVLSKALNGCVQHSQQPTPGTHFGHRQVGVLGNWQCCSIAEHSPFTITVL